MVDDEYASDYSLQELLVAATAREIKDNEAVFAGVGIPCLGAQLAKLTHARNAILAMESGVIGPQMYRLTFGIGDNPCMENALAVTSLWRLFSDMQKGFFDIGVIAGAQVDKYGNVNSTAIFGGGDYYTPRTRLPGSGGANDIASSVGRTVLMLQLEKRRFLGKVDYLTSPGYLDGPGAREKMKLPGGGPAAIITNKCIFRFNPETKEAYLDSLHPKVTLEEVLKEVSWDLKLAPTIATTPPPTIRQLEIIRILDSNKCYTGDGLRKMTFESYLGMLEGSLEKLKVLR
jgi:glutaconate CoA-transferase subunit B